jgi:hypothetical protein
MVDAVPWQAITVAAVNIYWFEVLAGILILVTHMIGRRICGKRVDFSGAF